MTAEQPASTLIDLLEDQPVVVYMPCVICAAPALIAFVEPPRILCPHCGFDGELPPEGTGDDP